MISFCLMPHIFDSILILWGEIRSQSLRGLRVKKLSKGFRAFFYCLPVDTNSLQSLFLYHLTTVFHDQRHKLRENKFNLLLKHYFSFGLWNIYFKSIILLTDRGTADRQSKRVIYSLKDAKITLTLSLEIFLQTYFDYSEKRLKIDSHKIS